MTEQEQRAAVVAEARTWLGTPYHHEACVKGAGVDCGMLLRAVYIATGVMPKFEVESYPRDWHLHRGEERYLSYVLQYADEIDSPPLPGDLVVWRFGRSFAHGAIAVQWPSIIHAYIDLGVVLDNATTNLDLSQRPHRFFRPKAWAQR